MATDLSEQLRFERVEQVFALPSVPYAEKRYLPDVPGIYFVLSEDGQVVYIGAANYSLRRRWRQHNETRTIRATQSVRIAYVVCEHYWQRRMTERFAVSSLQPILNGHFKHIEPFWPKGKARKPVPFTYPMAGDIATHRRIADR